MAASQGFGKSATNGLVFQYDLGDMVNSYKGIPKQNLLSYFSRTYGETNNADFKTHYYTTTTNVPRMGNISVENIDTYNTGANVCCQQCWYFGSPAVAGNTTYTYSIVYKSTTNYTNANFMYRYEYGASGYITEGGLHSDSNRTHLGDGWYHAWGVFTTNASTTSLPCYFYMYEYNTYNKISVAGVMLVPGNVIIPPKQFIPFGTTRSNSAALLPIVGNQTLDLSNVSFDGNGAMYFDGTNDYISTSNSSLIHGTSDWTYSAVLKFSGTPSLGTVFENGSWTSCLLIRFESTGFTIYSMGSYWGIFSFTPTLGVWYSFDFIRSGNVINFYVNGSYYQQISFTANVQPSSNLYIGMSQHSAGQCFNGNIQVAKIYNRALTLTEVKQNYNIYKSRFNLT